jgi:hypothetical protein
MEKWIQFLEHRFLEHRIDARAGSKGRSRPWHARHAFRRYEDVSLRYTGIDSDEGLSRYGFFNTVVAIEK